MIWIIIGIIALTSTGGHSTFFLNPELKKNVKTYVLEKERRKEIFSIMKESKKKQKEFVKKRKAYLKAAKKINIDRKSTREQYELLNEEYMKARSEIQVFSIARELEIKSIILEDEWEKIMEDILGDVSKNKIRDKMESGSDKYFNKLINACNKHITLDLKRDNAVASINRYREKVNASIPRLSEVSYKSIENIRDYNTPEENYKEVGKGISQIRKEIMKSFLDTRFHLLEYTTEAEWEKIISEINQLVNKGPKVN